MAPEPKKSRKRAAKPAATKGEGSVEPTPTPIQDEPVTKPAAKRAAKKAVAEVPTEVVAPAKVKKATTPVPVPLFQEAPTEIAPPKKARAPKPVQEESESEAAAPTNETDEQAQRRRRRRGGRGRRRPTDESSTDATLNEDGEALDPDSLDGEEDVLNADGTTHRRRRRRRAKGEGVEAGESVDEDGVVTVVKVRPPRESAPTRTERPSRNNRDRDRDRSGRNRDRRERDDRAPRDFTRRRGTIITEQEFLARRENVDREMLVRQTGDRTQIAVLEDKIMVEHYVNRNSNISYVGNVYLGRVQNVLPSMEAAFVDIGKGRNAVLYAGEVNWDAAGIAEGQTRKIEHVLKTGQSVLVQVTKDPIGQKGARLTF